MTKLLYCFIALFLVVGGGVFWWQEAARPQSPQEKTTKIFVIPKGEGISSIGQRLKGEGLIKSSLAFQILVVKEGLLGKIQAGDFRLSPAMGLEKILELLQRGSLDIWLTIPEGWRNEEIAQVLSQNLNISAGEFLSLTRQGYIFPDTYLFPRHAQAATVAAIMRANFERRFDEGLRQEAAKRGLTLDEVVILASLVEREVKENEDRPIVAGILRKRLKDGMPLQIDATVQYIKARQQCNNLAMNQCDWWPKITKEDLKIDSPYNTYLNPGLPPGPIANPGLAAIKAVIFPQESPFWYYLSDKEGKMHYGKTLEEHNQNIAKYLR